MGSRLIMEQPMQAVIYRGLRRLRRQLNRPGMIESLVKDQIEEIFLLAGICTTPVGRKHFASLFKYDYWDRYAKGSNPNQRFVFRKKGDERPYQTEQVQAALYRLRDHLNKKPLRRDLARIGAVALIFHTEKSGVNDIALISNHIPDCLPNTDYSARGNGWVEFHS